MRFQGARSKGPIVSPCGVAVYGPESDLVPGSLSPWVEHPEELNTVFSDPGLRPNMMRFTVIWDASQPTFSAIDSITELSVRVKPD